jgi:hypothetical protein
MPITYRVDHPRRLVVATGTETVTPQDIFEYQRSAWSRPDVAGYDELVDMTHAKRLEFGSADSARELASLSAKTDLPSGGEKFAIVAPGDLAFGLGRLYQTYRSLDKKSTKRVEVFRTMKEALAFLGVDGDVTTG